MINAKHGRKGQLLIMLLRIKPDFLQVSEDAIQLG